MNKKNVFFLAGLASLLLAARLGIILTSVELISHYDELDLGTIARELARGLTVPFWYFHLDSYSGEALILGPLVLPFAKLFGQNVFAVKMVPLLFSLLTLSAVFFFMLRYFGDKAARIAGILFVLAPPGLVQFSLCNMTGHTEAFFFAFVSLFCFYEYFYRKRGWFLPAWGLAAGFAVWFYYANAMMVVSCLAILFLSDRKVFFRAMPVFIPLFFLAFSPWFFSNFRNQFMGMELVSENLSGFGLDRFIYTLKKPVKLFLINLPLSLFTLPVYFIPRAVIAYVYYAGLLLALLPLLKKRQVFGPAMIFLVYPAVYAVVLTLSRFDFDREIGFVGFRYATPMIFMLLLAAAYRFSVHSGRKIFIFLLALGALGQGALLFNEPFGRAAAYKGYSYYQLGTRWHFNLTGAFSSYEDFQNKTRHFPLDERRLILWGISQMAQWNDQELLFEARPGYAKDVTVQSMALKEPQDYAVFAYEWMGGLRKFVPPDGMELAENTVRAIPGPSRKYFCQGWLWGIEQSGNFVDCPDCYPGKNICEIKELEKASVYINDLYVGKGPERLRKIAAFEGKEKILAYRGVGHSRFFADSVLNPLYKKPVPLEIGQADAQSRQDMNWGIGWGIREKFREDKVRALDWINRLSESAREAARQGMDAYDQWYKLS